MAKIACIYTDNQGATRWLVDISVIALQILEVDAITKGTQLVLQDIRLHCYEIRAPGIIAKSNVIQGTVPREVVNLTSHDVQLT